MVRFIAPAAAAVAIVAVIAMAGGRLPTSAQTGPVVSVDAVSDAANTATAVGPIDTCRSTTSGATFDVDVVIQGVTNIAGFQANLLYNPAVLKVTAVNYNFLLSTTGFIVLNLGNSTPDADGNFLLAATMFSFIAPLTGASGSGVLARVTFQAVGSGLSALDLTSVKLSDASGNPVPPSDANKFYTGPVNDAAIVVGSSCTADTDGDGVPDVSDNCPTIPNPGQENTDAALAAAGATLAVGVPLVGDGLGDACDNERDNDSGSQMQTLSPGTPAVTCPTGVSLPLWADCIESYLGTNPLDNCKTLVPGSGGDANPSDINVDGSTNILDVFQMFPFWALPVVAPPGTRRDLNADGSVNILDVFKMFPFWTQTCT